MLNLFQHLTSGETKAYFSSKKIPKLSWKCFAQLTVIHFAEAGVHSVSCLPALLRSSRPHFRKFGMTERFTWKQSKYTCHAELVSWIFGCRNLALRFEIALAISFTSAVSRLNRAGRLAARRPAENPLSWIFGCRNLALRFEIALAISFTSAVSRLNRAGRQAAPRPAENPLSWIFND